MRYDGLIIRPPSEADSLILQVAVGCSHNQCTFCPAFKPKQFRAKPLEHVLQDIDSALHAYGPGVRRVFLCDGDPLILPSAHLRAILECLNAAFPKLQRVGIYGNAKSILKRTPEDLAQLRSLKLGIVYL
ncbi:MAG: radical SAM protein, partial [Deltaproteobacteria bacterium]|nr:radical SAM protein [Deltaproteobacteria bacterium]